MEPNIQRDFQICISVPLKSEFLIIHCRSLKRYVLVILIETSLKERSKGII